VLPRANLLGVSSIVFGLFNDFISFANRTFIESMNLTSTENMFVNDKLGGVWQEAVLAYFKLLSQPFLGRTEGTHDRRYSDRDSNPEPSSMKTLLERIRSHRVMQFPTSHKILFKNTCPSLFLWNFDSSCFWSCSVLVNTTHRRFKIRENVFAPRTWYKLTFMLCLCSFNIRSCKCLKRSVLWSALVGQALTLYPIEQPRSFRI
jgi:hypothetical protein